MSILGLRFSLAHTATRAKALRRQYAPVAIRPPSRKEYIPHLPYAGERRRKALPWYGTALACIGKRALSQNANGAKR